MNNKLFHYLKEHDKNLRERNDVGKLMKIEVFVVNMYLSIFFENENFHFNLEKSQTLDDISP